MRFGKKETRASRRLPVYHLARYRLVAEPNQRMAIVTVKDISEAGMRCRAEKMIPSHSLLEVEVQFPFLDHPEACLATVMWTKKLPVRTERYEIGLKFNGINDFLSRAVEKGKIKGTL
ncbi:MAG TPA: PilZ domain-containing protein [Candidatus Omnitrophota bacterium]|jgi:hypothetical protein|nr:PilZ domain-containing protein [Candidatus Omnitrophota bacterium]HQB94727.1 PilZ domain-containing protein [Candidatus Omnitrophota bacterium]